jgi:hypothetical protein
VTPPPRQEIYGLFFVKKAVRARAPAQIDIGVCSFIIATGLRMISE